MAVLVTALEGQGVLGTPGRSEVFIEPIRIKTIVIRILQHILDGITLQFLVVDELLGVQHLRLMRKRLKDVFAGIGDGCRSFSALLGGDENHTIARFSAIDGRGSRILEDLHGLDQRRIEILDAVDLEAVDNDERSDFAAVGRYATDVDFSAASWSSGVRDDLNARHLSLKQTACIGEGSYIEIFGLEACYRAGYLLFGGLSITDHYRFVQHHRSCCGEHSIQY